MSAINYKAIGENNIMGDLVSQVLNNRGIKDKERFLNPSIEDVIHYSNLKNMERAVELFDKHQDNGSTVDVLVDSDADGYTSSSIIIKYIRKNFPNMAITYHIHKERQNGLTPDMMKAAKKNMPDLLIIPDASSNDHEQHKELSDLGIDILVLDHHLIENGKESEHAVIINPQLCLDSYPNDEIAAGGIVYKFCQALDDRYGTKDADNYLDLVAVSSVADIMDLTTPETRYYVYKGLKNITNPFLKELVKKNAEWAEEIYPRVVSFSMANFMNAVIRVGTMEDKETMLRALLGEEETTTRISKYRGKEREVTETLPEKAYRLCTNARGRQNRRKNKLIEEALEAIESQNLDRLPVIIVELTDIPSGFSGLIASSIAEVYRRPAVVIEGDGEIYMGSLRGYENGAIKNMKEFLEGFELFDMIAGHENAAGVRISYDNMSRLIDILSSDKLNFSQDSQIEVDFTVHANSLSPQLAESFDDMAYIWGQGCKEPKIALTGVEVSTDNIQVKSFMKMFVNSTELISFSVVKEMAEVAERKGHKVTFDAIGSLSLNRFRGNTTPQFVIDTLVIKDVKEEGFGGFVF